MAWLNATPKPHERSKAAQPKYARPELSRAERLKKDGLPIRMPPNPAPELIRRLTEIGLTESGGMGPSPLSWLTIDAFQRCTGIALAPWEARLHRHLSTEYLSEYRRAERENCPPPWRGEVTVRERKAEQALLESILG
jgi:hypothetical protein